ncbi:MAG: STAS domain-containing protein [Gammaproteobacteria bacterium]|nr:STAS domain-containing protein [Gammaproteobacteria bacterium]
MATEKPLSAELSLVKNSVRISGVLNFETVPVLMKQAEQLFGELDKVSVDLAEVSDSNSAGLAMLVEMQRIIKMQKKSIDFKNLPEQITIIAAAYGIDTELGSFLNLAANS